MPAKRTYWLLGGIGCLIAWFFFRAGASIVSPAIHFFLPLLAVLLSQICFAVFAAGSPHRKRAAFLVTAIVLTAIAWIFVWIALWNPQASLPFPQSVFHVICGVYASVTVFCYLAAVFTKK